MGSEGEIGKCRQRETRTPHTVATPKEAAPTLPPPLLANPHRSNLVANARYKLLTPRLAPHPYPTVAPHPYPTLAPHPSPPSFDKPPKAAAAVLEAVGAGGGLLSERQQQVVGKWRSDFEAIFPDDERLGRGHEQVEQEV